MRVKNGRWIALLGVFALVFPAILIMTGCSAQKEPDNPNYVKGADWKKKAPGGAKAKGDE